MTTGDAILRPLLPFSSICFGHVKNWGMSQELGELPVKKVCRGLGRHPVTLDQKRPSPEGNFTGLASPKHAEDGKITPSPLSKLESLPLRLLEEICRSLTVADLCRLSQVNRYCNQTFSRQEFWAWKAGEKGITLGVEKERWNMKTMAAECRLLHVRPLTQSPVYMEGDLIVIDPFKIFFKGRRNEKPLHRLIQIVRPFLICNTDCIVSYRGLSAVFITSMFWDSDTAFEVTRNGTSLGVDVVRSRILAAIPKKLADILREENGTEVQGGVYVPSVDGEFRSSRDGDFIILSSSAPKSGVSDWTDDEALEHADVMCASGGSWTFSDDSGDEEDDTMEMTEELARFLREEEDD